MLECKRLLQALRKVRSSPSATRLPSHLRVRTELRPRGVTRGHGPRPSSRLAIRLPPFEQLLHSVLVGPHSSSTPTVNSGPWSHDPFRLAAAQCVVLVYETGPATPSPRLLSARVVALLPPPCFILFHPQASLITDPLILPSFP
jgi:hypothetical protein